MRNPLSGIGVVAAVMLMALAVVSQPGCEEVLDTCPPCGSVADGAVNISGNPALDGSFEALQRILTLAREAEADLDQTLSALAAAAGAPLPDDGRYDVAAVDELLEVVDAALLRVPGVTVALAAEWGGCRVDAELARGRQAACERQAGCYVRDDCDEGLVGSCTGLCIGDCGDACGGLCFVPAASQPESCLAACVGACDGVEDFPCPGRCLGSCDGICSSHGPDGRCAGLCAGLCTGTCEHTTPMTCAGLCRGYCRVPNTADYHCELCRGDCTEGNCAGDCRGHYRVDGCDQPLRCEGVLQCRETGRLLAWAGTTCSPAAVEVRVTYDEAFAGDRGEHAVATRILERALARLARHRAILSLLVDGVDVTGELDPQALAAVVATGQGSDAPRGERDLCGLCVVPARRHLPLSGLLARLGMFADGIGDTGLRVTAGALPCVAPAFAEAHALLLGLLPVNDPGLCDRCAAGEEVDPHLLQPARGEGLYRVLDGIDRLFAGLGAVHDDG